MIGWVLPWCMGGEMQIHMCLMIWASRGSAIHVFPVNYQERGLEIWTVQPCLGVLTYTLLLSLLCKNPPPSTPLLTIIAQFLIIDSTGHFETERESRMGWRWDKLHCGLFGGLLETGSKFLPQNGPVADPEEARVTPLFLDRTEARRAEKKIGEIPPLHSMAGWSARRTHNPAVPGSSPALATCRICSRSSRVQIIGHTCK